MRSREQISINGRKSNCSRVVKQRISLFFWKYILSYVKPRLSWEVLANRFSWFFSKLKCMFVLRGSLARQKIPKRNSTPAYLSIFTQGSLREADSQNQIELHNEDIPEPWLGWTRNSKWYLHSINLLLGYSSFDMC